MDLTEAQSAALALIIRFDLPTTQRFAWASWDAIDASHPGALRELERLGVVERWKLPDGIAVTLTPYGAAVVCRETIVERWDFEEEEVLDQWDRPIIEDGAPVTRVVASETPFWEPQAKVRNRKPLQTPKYADTVPLHQLYERDHPVYHDPDDVLMDDVSGKPVIIQGQQVKRDRRMTKKQAKPTKKRKGKR